MLANDLKLVTKDIAAEVFSVSVKTIDNYIKDGVLPPPTRFVSKEYWHPDEFRAFLARTFQAHAHGNDGVTGVPEGLPAEGDLQVPAPLGMQSKRHERTADSSPTVRERARRKRLIAQLNS